LTIKNYAKKLFKLSINWCKNKLLRSKLRSNPDGASLFPNRLHPRCNIGIFSPLKMKIIYHKGLKPKDWFRKSIYEQMANVGSEVFRFIKWRRKNPEDSRLAFERALELLDLTLADKKNRNALKEIARLRGILVDYYFDNQYCSSADFLERYFYAFNFAARIGH